MNEKLYYVMAWNRREKPFPRYEVRPMPVDVGSDQRAVEVNLSFAEADKKRKALEDKA